MRATSTSRSSLPYRQTCPRGLVLKKNKVVCLNVGGLVGRRRRKTLFYWLKHTIQPDILLAQETHSTSDTQAQQWAQEWGGLNRASRGKATERAAWFSHSASPHTGGTAIFVSKGFHQSHIISHIHTTSAHNGFYVSITATHRTTQRTITYASCYLPAKAAPRLAAIADIPPLQPQEERIMGGDYNCFHHRSDSSKPTYFPRGGTELETYCAENDLGDVWSLVREPPNTQFTRIHPKTGTATRIDRIYASPTLHSHIHIRSPCSLSTLLLYSAHTPLSILETQHFHITTPRN